MKKILKKLLSILVASCFILSLANLSAYATNSELTKLETTQTQEYTGDFTSVNIATSKPKATASKTISKSAVTNKAKQSLKLINKLLKKKGVSKLAKTWLNKAKTLINKTLKSKKSNATKYAWLKKALTAITAISKAKASTLSLIKQTVTSGSVFSSLKTVLKKNATYKIYANYTAKIISSINKLVNKSSVSSLAKTWLKKAKTLAWNKMFGKGSNATKTKWLKKALTAVNNIAKSNGSVLSIVKQTTASGSVFTSLKTVLKNNITYKIYTKYGNNGISLISAFSKKFNINQSNIYNIFVNKGVKKSDLDFFAEFILDDLKNENFFHIYYGSDTINKSIAEIKKIVDKANNINNNDNTNENDNNSIENQINTTYGTNGLNLINGISKKFNLDKTVVYNKFVESGVTKDQVNTVSGMILGDIEAGRDIFRSTWGPNYVNIGYALTAIKQLIDANNNENNNNENNNENNNNENNNENNNNENNNENNNNDNPAQKPYQQSLNESTALINNLLNNNNVSDLAKSWLNAAQTRINEIANSDKTDAEKETLISAALASIQNVSNNNCSIEVLEQESAEGGIFSSLQETVLNDNPDYQAYQITKTYSEESIAIANTLSQKTGLSQSVILQQFAKAGVTNEQLVENAQAISNGGSFVNHSAIALSKVLNVDKNLVAVQQLAVAVAKGSNISSNSSLENQLEVFKMNGKTSAAIYTDSTLDDVIANLKAGEGIVLKVISGASFISIVKKNDNCFIVTDKDYTYNGTIVDGEFTAAELKKLMNSQTASYTFTANGLLYKGSRSMWYEPANSEGKISFVSNSSGIKEGEDAKLNTQYVQPAITAINNLLNAAGTSAIAKTWLNKAKEIINGIINDNNSVANEKEQLKQVAKSIERVAAQNASIAVLLQETSSNNLFNGLQEEVLNKDANIKNIIYPLYTQNVQASVETVNNLLSNEQLGEVEQTTLNGVYNLISEKLNEIANIVNSGSSNYATQQQWLQQAADSVQRIQNENASLAVLDQETQEGSVFAPLRQALENTETFQVYQVYGDLGATAIRSFAKYMNVLETVVFQQFVRFNVTAEKMQNAASSLLNLIQRGSNFFNCASLAVSKYLGIERITAVIQELAAEIVFLKDGGSLGTDGMNTYASSHGATEKVLQVNGENAILSAIPTTTVEDLMNGLQVGEKAILAVMANLGGHAIMIKRESNGWGVFDTNRNGGEEVIYTPENFITLMTGTQGTSVQGVTTNGEPFSASVYYTAIRQYQSYEWTYDESGYINGYNRLYPNGLVLITDANGIISQRDEHALLK